MTPCPDTRYRSARFDARVLSTALWVALFAALALPGVAYASRYRVALILFINNSPVGNEQPTPVQLPVANEGISMDDTAALAARGIHIFPGNDAGLKHEWRGLRYSQDFHPAMKLSWIQTAAASGTAIHIAHGAPLAGSGLAPITGTIALHIGTLLHLEAHLRFSYVNANGILVSYKLNETRRVRFNELHYLDSPRLGVLARVTKVK